MANVQDTATDASKRLRARLEDARRRRFVGRQEELELFRSALVGDLTLALLHVYGPGGVGKTTLLQEFAHLAGRAGRPCLAIDGRNVTATTAGFRQAVDQALVPVQVEALEQLPNVVLLIDTYERLAAVDDWLRTEFLPQLPEQALVVLAGRNPPSTEWRTDDGWRALARIVALADLTPDESRRYLASWGIPAASHATLTSFTHGHPLALSLVADAYRHGADAAFLDPTDERSVIHQLVERFIQDVPTIRHRTALELCAVAWATSEALLAERFGAEDGAELFGWLRTLSFIEVGPHGLFPHDLVRDVLTTDLYWRNPAAYSAHQQTILAYLRPLHWNSRGLEQQRYGLDMIFVNRQAPGMKDFFAWEAMDDAYAEPATLADHAAIEALVLRHEGEESAAIARHWLARQPEAFLAYRTLDGHLYGCMAQLALHRAAAEDVARDPAVAAALAYIDAQEPVAAGEAISYMRFWMAAASYQNVSIAVNLAAANCVIHWRTTPKLAWSFVAMAHPEFMAPHFESIRFPRTPAADFQVGGRTYGVFSHNWKADPLYQWQVDTKHADAGLLTGPTAPSAVNAATINLPPDELAAAIRQALRDLTRPDLLATNPLLQTALLPREARTAAGLRGRLLEAISVLNGNPKDAKSYRALWHTYVEPEISQEKTAELLDLPFNTYRYHLNTGLSRLAAMLAPASPE